MNDANAIYRLQRGDLSGLIPLVERYQLKAVRVAVLITRDRALAEDVVQTSFLQFYHHIDQFDARRKFEPYFLRSVVNAAIQAARRQDRQLPLEAPDRDESVGFADVLADPAPSPEALLEATTRKAEVRAALDRLSPEQRAAVVLRYYLDLGEAEMSSVLNTPTGTIKWRLHSARQRLRALLREE